MGAIAKDISINVGLGIPVEYKGLKVFPIKVRDFLKFSDSYGILDIDKSSIGNIEVIKMSYLEYLIYLILGNNEIKQKFINIIDLCFGIAYAEEFKNKTDIPQDELLIENIDENNFNLYINGRNICLMIKKNKARIILNNKELSASDFDNLRKIILYQNIEGYDDRPMSNDFKRIVTDYFALKNKGIKNPTLEYKVGVVLSSSGYTHEKIMDMPYRLFEITFNTIVSKYDYIVNMIAVTQGAKIDIDHWVYKKDKDIYDDIFSDANEYAKQITSV